MTIAMWVKHAHKTTLQVAFPEAIIVEKDMFGLKDNPHQEPNQHSTYTRRKKNVPKPTNLNKNPYEMDNMKKLLENISNDMVDLKRSSSDNQVNNRGQQNPPLRRPYQPPLNQPPPNPGETLTFDEIYYILKSLTSTPQSAHNDTKQEAT